MSRKLTPTTLQRESKQSWRSSKSSNPSKSTINSKTKVKAAVEKPGKPEKSTKRENDVMEAKVEPETEAPKPLQRVTSADTVNVKEEHDDKETKNCFDDWKEFYLQIYGTIKSKSDLIIAFTHYILMKNGFRCLGLGDDRTYSEDEVGKIYLPEGWSQFSKYSIRYIYNRMLYILIGVHLDHRLLINFLNTRTNVVTNITVFPEITVRATYGGSINVLIPFPEKLAQTLYSNLIQNFTDMQACDRPPKILSRTKQQSNPWDELAARRSKDVYPIMEEDNVSEIEESQEIQTLDGQAQRRASWADGKPQAANIGVMNSLKTRLDETVEPVKDAIVSYVEAMVNNWFSLYGNEIMKSGKLAIQDLADQRQMIEKYMNFAKPVAEPKSGFVIYNTKVTLDDSKQILLRDTVEKSKLDLKVASNVNAELKKSLTETAHEPKLPSVKEEHTNIPKTPNASEATLVAEATRVKTRNYYKNIRPKIDSGIRSDKTVASPPPQRAKKTAEVPVTVERNTHNFANTHTEPKVVTVLKPALKKVRPQATSSSRTDKEIKKAYKAYELETARRNASNNRGKGGTSINSSQQNSQINVDGKLKNKRSKHKATPTSKNFKNNAAKSSTSNSIGTTESQIKLNRSSPIKKIRFNLSKTNETPSYLSSLWPSTYKSLENLLKSSFPFREQAREPGGSTDPKELLNKYDLKDDLDSIIYSKDTNDLAETQNKTNKECIYDLDKDGENLKATSNLLQTIEEHFAEQIEAKRLELLEMVRRRDLPGIMDNNEDAELKNNFLNAEHEEDVGCFVQPADEWAQWEFKKRLKEIREKEVLNALNNKKVNFNE
ncbi:uncharacterized protein LOC105227955 [Bactrocera dorsalis]|uniref:Uncharacterized protein LOC105227955 n=1 Tax=Bactrocera dorsalis TaxID=27457 RepID=A0A6I9V7W0_BACDO|nr:uncharacterized protein LOC105227955 [Bactrocera dorsalis]